jgi:hypothetical protein
LCTKQVFIFLEIVKVTAQVLEECASEEGSDQSESDESSSEDDEEDNKKLQQMKSKAAKNQVDISANTEDYFLAQSSSVHTSDRTLNRLKNPRLNQETIDNLMEDVDDSHIKEKQLLMKDYQQQFPHWSFLLGFVDFKIFFFENVLQIFIFALFSC